MPLHRISAALFLASALLFLYLGLGRGARDATFIALGVVFLGFAAVRFRGSRRR